MGAHASIALELMAPLRRKRLFDHRFPDLFEWIVDYMDELPVARRSSKAQLANPLLLGFFSA